MASPIRAHPRTCTICEKCAENPYQAVWDSFLNDRISFCTRKCFDEHKEFRRYLFTVPLKQRHLKPTISIDTKGRRNSL